MGNPTLRSLNQILGDLAGTFLSELDRSGVAPGIQGLKPGSPFLAIFEAVAQSQFRVQGQILSLLSAYDLDAATGDTLDRLGATEQLSRTGALRATGRVTVSDGSFAKAETLLSASGGNPPAGATQLYVSDASTWAKTGELYVGRGTPNVEGPVGFTAVAEQGQHWVISLSTPLSKAHLMSETVTLAQGGNRTIPAGQQVRSISGAGYAVSQTTILLDGETSVDVTVVCTTPGVVGNAPAGAISVAASPSFTGMKVTNALPFTNGRAIEDDDSYRDRIRKKRFSRQQGTWTAIVEAAREARPADEGTAVTDVRYLPSLKGTSRLIVDDGTGYEPKKVGVATEILTSSALGGETRFALAKRPVAKASATTTVDAPFDVVAGSVLDVLVGGRLFSHVFGPDFGQPGAATAQEVASSINADGELPLIAYVVNGGSRVMVVADDIESDDVEVLAGGANLGLAFPTARFESVRLFVNDVLLSKDGYPAWIASRPQEGWLPLVAGETLTVSVDGTPAATYSFSDEDFLALGNSTKALSAVAPLADWAAVLNAKIPGITAKVSGRKLIISSNKPFGGALAIAATSSLVARGMFDPAHLTATGRVRDYVVDYNLGHIEMVRPLMSGDKLVVGSANTRAYVETTAITGTVSISAGGGKLWFVIDGAAAAVPHTANGQTSYYLSGAKTTNVTRIKASHAAWANIKAGDWVVVTDSIWTGFSGSPVGAFRVCRVSSDGTWFEVEIPANALASTDRAVTNAAAYKSIYFVRTNAQVQQVDIAGPASLTAAQIPSVLKLKGATATTVGNKVRVTTDTYGENGAVMFVAANAVASAIGFTVAAEDKNIDPGFASVESQNSDVGTPRISAGASTVTGYTVLSGVPYIKGPDFTSGLAQGALTSPYWMRPSNDASFTNRYGTNTGDVADIVARDATNGEGLDHLHAAPITSTNNDRVAAVARFRLGAVSALDLAVDGKRVSVPLYRRVKPDPAVAYGQSIRLLDVDNSSQSLSKAFGTQFDFSQFALHGRARCITHPLVSTKSVLWRTRDFNARPATATVSYRANPTPTASLDVRNVHPDGSVIILLPTGTARAVNVVEGSKWRVQQGASTQTLASAFVISSLTRTGSSVTATLTLPADVASHGFVVGDTVYLYSSSGTFPSGNKVVVNKTDTTITYAESGTATTVTPVNSFVSWSATPCDFSTVVVGDYVSVTSGTQITSASTSNDPLTALGFFHTFQMKAVGKYHFQTRKGTTASGWLTVGPSQAWHFYPLVATSAWDLSQAINLNAIFPITGTVMGDGSAVIASDVADDTAATAYFADPVLQIAKSTYVAGNLNYTMTLRIPVATALTGTNGWATEEFRLVPTTTKNLTAFLGSGAISPMNATGASILASSRAGHLQLASGTQGTGGSLAVLGGTANAVYLPVVSAGISADTTKLLVNVRTTPEVATACVNQTVKVEATSSTPKILDWTASSVLSISASGAATITDGTAWAGSGGGVPNFGSRYYVEKAGNLTSVTLAPAGQSSTWVLPKTGDWAVFHAGKGTYETASTGAVVATSYANSIGAASVKLSDGRIFVCGGANKFDSAATGFAPVNNWVIYDPTAQAYTFSGTMSVARAFHTATLLPDGKVLVAGGYTGVNTSTNSAIVFDPSARTWGSALTMQSARARHTATLLPNGGVFIAGGMSAANTYVTPSETYSAGTFSAKASMLYAVAGHTAVLVGDVVQVGGGYGSVGSSSYIQTYSPTSDGWGVRNLRITPRHSHQCVVTSTGELLFIGGIGHENVAAAPGFDPATWGRNFLTTVDATGKEAVGSMAVGRAGCSATLMPDGSIYVAGGLTSDATATRAAEILDPATRKWTWATGSMAPHVFHAAHLLNSGSVFLFGRTNNYGDAASAYDEVWDPSQNAASAGNLGAFRIALAETANDRVWFENPNSVVEDAFFGMVSFYTYNSILPGDTLTISSTNIGPVGPYKVSSISATDPRSFTVTVPAGFSGIEKALLTNLPFVSLSPATPTSSFYSIHSIYPTPNEIDYTTISLSSTNQPELFTSGVGARLKLLDRLSFPTSTFSGLDGYSVHTGLLAEVSRTVFGDESDPATYPGVAAAGARIEVAPPAIRRVKLAVAIRAAPTAFDIVSKVQSAIAGAINDAGPGPIALSSLIAAAEAVDGLDSIVLLDPISSATGDSILVQRDEKAMVLNLEDVSVSYLGG